MRLLILMMLCASLMGCGYYLTPRPPVMERKLGLPGRESVGALATAADYRLAYVRIGGGNASDPTGRSCFEPPPDAAGQFAAELSASGKTPYHGGDLSADAAASMALSMKELFRRSQGVQFYRDGMFALCNMYLNDGLTKEAYISQVNELRKEAAELIGQEISYLQQKTDPIDTPSLPARERPKSAKNGTEKGEAKAEDTQRSEPAKEAPKEGAASTGT